MPPQSMKRIEILAQAFLAELAPAALEAPQPLDLEHLIERVLPQFGVRFYPGDRREMGRREAYTDPFSSDGIEILLEEAQWYDLFSGGPRSHRARATAAHELSHAILHVPELRRMRAERGSEEELLLARKARRKLKAYEDPEWQAWAMAGCLLVPRRTLEMIPVAKRDLWTLADTYRVSSAMMRSHLKRLKLGHTIEGM